jgi:hypothetical protein
VDRAASTGGGPGGAWRAAIPGSSASDDGRRAGPDEAAALGEAEDDGDDALADPDGDADADGEPDGEPDTDGVGTVTVPMAPSRPVRRKP